jgi:DNA-binding transcriptional ArsR family regulator
MESPTLAELNLMHASICQAFTDPKRILILYTLFEQPRHVSELAKHLSMPQSTVSRHLRVLREHSLVKPERKGAAVYYRVTEDRMIGVIDTMRQVMRDLLERRADILA